MSNAIIQRAQGCLLDQLAGDSLGSLVEFKTEEQVRSLYPNRVKKLADGGISMPLVDLSDGPGSCRGTQSKYSIRYRLIIGMRLVADVLFQKVFPVRKVRFSNEEFTA